MSQINTNEAVAKLAAGEITVIDCREAAEVQATGKAEGAIHIPLSLLALQAKEKIPADKPVAIYCAAGGRAGMATQTLRSMGYEAHNIGGFADWAASGGPVSR